MDIGFQFAIRSDDTQAAFSLLESMAREREVQYLRAGAYAAIELCHRGEIMFVEEESRILGYCDTALAGPGFHVAAIEFMDAFTETSGLSVALEDTAEYTAHRDFDALREQHYYPWLDTFVAAVAANPIGLPEASMTFCWQDGTYIPQTVEGSVVTPMGRFSMEALPKRVARDGIAAFAGDFFLWPEREREARHSRNTALALLWEDCYFMPSRRSEEDAEVNGRIIALLEEAAELDPDQTLPLPLAEYKLVCELDGRIPGDPENRPEMESDFPIGYRRGVVGERLGNLRMTFPGHYLYRQENEGDTHVFYDGAEEDWHRVQVTGFGTDEPEEEFDGELFQNTAEAPVFFAVGDGRCKAAYAGKFQDKGVPLNLVVSEILCGLQATQVVIMFERDEEKQWAFDLLRQMRAHVDYELN